MHSLVGTRLASIGGNGLNLLKRQAWCFLNTNLVRNFLKTSLKFCRKCSVYSDQSERAAIS